MYGKVAGIWVSPSYTSKILKKGIYYNNRYNYTFDIFILETGQSKNFRKKTKKEYFLIDSVAEF